MKVVAARDLPVMDRSSELTDAFVEVSTAIILSKISCLGWVWSGGVVHLFFLLLLAEVRAGF